MITDERQLKLGHVVQQSLRLIEDRIDTVQHKPGVIQEITDIRKRDVGEVRDIHNVAVRHVGQVSHRNAEVQRVRDEREGHWKTDLELTSEAHHRDEEAGVVDNVTQVDPVPIT